MEAVAEGLEVAGGPLEKGFGGKAFGECRDPSFIWCGMASAC